MSHLPVNHPVVGPISSFLFELRNELALDLTPQQVQAVLSETETHLREHARALAELGSPEWSAEAESVAAFGEVKEYARAVVDASGPAPAVLLRSVRLLAALGCAIGIVTVLTIRGWHGLAPLVLPFLFLLGVAASSFRARRWDFTGLAKISLATSLAGWGLMSLFWVRLPGPSQYEARPWPEVEAQRQQMLSRLPELLYQENFIRRASMEFQNDAIPPLTHARILGLERDGQILTPSSRILDEGAYIGSVRYHPRSYALGARIWKYQGASMADAVGDSIDRWRRLADEYGAIYRGGFAPNFVRMWPWGAIFVPFSLVPLWVAHALGVLLALVSRAMRRNPRPSRFGRA